MLYLSNACFSDILCRNSQPCSKGFFAVLLEKKFEYLLETKVSNRLLLVLGVISPRAKSPFIFFLTFLFFTPHVRQFKHVFRFQSFQGRFFVCFWGNFGIIFFFFNSFL